MSGSVNNNDNNRNHANAGFPHMSPASQKVATLSSEIDDIFTRKAETRAIQTTNQPSNSNPKQKRRKKKRSETQTAERKRPAPEIVLDPSTTRQSHAPTSKTTSHDRPVPSRKKRKLIETKFDQENFGDSRGTGPRKRVLLPWASPRLSDFQAVKPTKVSRYIRKTNSGLTQELEVSSNAYFAILFTSR
jgi:hypothetical protein